MRYVLGVDQGATKTAVVLADETGRILSSAVSPGANHAVTGMDSAMYQIRSAVDSVLAQAAVDLKSVAAIGAGITGADFDREYRMLHDELFRQFRIPVRVVNDCMIALYAESRETGNVIICGGTGLNIGLLSGNGRKMIFGYYIDDAFQGAEALGSRVLRAITDAELGICPPTILTEKALKYFGTESVDGLLELLYTENERKNMKFLVPDMVDCALRGDGTAKRILDDFSDGIANYTISGLRRCSMLNEPVSVYFSGGIFRDNQLLISSISEKIARIHPHITAVEAVFEPVIGAALLGLELLFDDQLPTRVADHVHDSAKSAGLTRSHSHLIQKPVA